MAHFSEINADNIVIRVVVVPNAHERRGQAYLADDLQQGGNWLQTSYNTRGGVHKFGGVPFRKNFGEVGFSYDPVRDAFIPQKPDGDWVLDESTCRWKKA